MDTSVFGQVAKTLTSLIATILVFFGVQHPPETSEIATEMVSEESTSTQSTKIVTVEPSPSPLTTPQPSIPPSPSPEPKIDLHLESVLLLPEKGLSLHGKQNLLASSQIVSGKKYLALDPAEELKKRGSLRYKKGDKPKYILLSVRNNGHEDAENVAVNVIVDQKSIMTFAIEKIEKQSVHRVQKELVDTGIRFPSELGKHTVEVQINPKKTLPETRFDNNTKRFEYEYIP